MKKLAVFVEGHTEQLFLERLITEIAGAHTIVIEKRKLTGASHSISPWVNLSASAPASGQGYFVLIVDCSGYDRVKSAIRDNYVSLADSGYSAIFGIRDVYPIDHADIDKLRLGLDRGLETRPIRVVFALGVMEIETWFICEHTHFVRIDPLLTIAYIKDNLGFDPSVDDIQLRRIPSNDLNDIYGLVRQRYKKHFRSIQRMLDLLDYEHLYCNVLHRLPDLQTLVESIDAFLTH